MSVVVRGMKMPASCQECPFNCENAWCLVPGDWRERYYIPRGDVSEYCPLVELPEHHGDLIDRKDVLDACEFIGERPTVDNPYSEKYACRSEIIENIPAVIEQED